MEAAEGLCCAKVTPSRRPRWRREEQVFVPFDRTVAIGSATTQCVAGEKPAEAPLLSVLLSALLSMLLSMLLSIDIAAATDYRVRLPLAFQVTVSRGSVL
jgi:hypothetical protein